MADSLVLGGLIEVLNNGVVSDVPACAGAMFQLLYDGGMDFGAPQPTTDFVASLLLDGERPFGRRASNRTVALVVKISAPTTQLLVAAREVLEEVIDQDQWTMVWTRDPGSGTALPMIIDCFRAQPSKPIYDPLTEQRGVMRLALTIPARPYGRSDVQQIISFASPVPSGPPAPPAVITLDQFNTIASPQCTQSAQAVVGPNTACWDPDDPLRVGDPGGQQTPFLYGPVAMSPAVSLAGLTALQLWLGFGTRYYHALRYHHRTSGVSCSVTLTDASGNSLSFSRQNLVLPVSPVFSQPVFSRVTIPIPQGATGSNGNPFNYTTVSSYTLLLTSEQNPVPRLAWVTCYLDNLAALPPSQSVAPVTRGYVYQLNGLVGTARSPMSLTFQQPPSAGTPSTITAAGPGNYTVPSGTAWLDVQAWGAGGAGSSLNAAGVGGGGGGGEFSEEPNFAASPAQSVPYTIGAGGTSGATPVPGQSTVFGPGPAGSLQVAAAGGLSAGFNSSAGGAGGSSVLQSGTRNSVENAGGTGRTASGGLGGGGGSSAGPTLPGNTPAGTASTTFTSSGTWLCPSGVSQVLAEAWGGGAGGGCGSSSGIGGGGGGGEYRSSFIPVTPGNTYTVTIGAAGAGGAGSGGGGQNGSAGGSSTFTGDSGHAVTGQPGQPGLGGQWYRTGGGNGGTGGTGTTHFDGGDGGDAYPYGGGGGSSAGTSSQGNQGSSPSGGSSPPGGGAGGAASGAHSGGGTAGSAPGGGGGGTYQAGSAAGAGAKGQIRLTFAAAGAPTNAGGAAVAGGGAGGNGGGTAGSAGSAGSAPGGGGGGANSAGTSLAGGAGAAGQLKITPFASAAVRTLIVHRPPLGTLKMFQPLVSVGNGGDVPNGSTQYTMPQPLSGVNAAFGGTYSVYLIASSLSGTGARTVFVTVNQYEYNGGPVYSVSTVPVTFTPSQVFNGIFIAGVLTLPIKFLPADNTSGYYTITVTDSNTSDRWLDCILLDTMGQTVVVNEKSGSGYITYYIDAPDPDKAIGNVLGSWNGRPSAVSVMDACDAISGGPLVIEPAEADNQLFAYCADGVAPAIGVMYWPNWFFDRYA